MNILITGGAGFIGSHLADKYVQEGYEVGIFDNFSTGKKDFCSSEVRIFEGDICDKKRVREVFQKFRPDIVSHHAGHISYRSSFDDPAFNAEKNILGSINVFREAGECGVRQVVFSSTGGVMFPKGWNTFPAEEVENPKVSSPYALSKLCAEKYLDFFAEYYGFLATTFRYANVFGPRQTPKSEAGVISIFLQQIFLGKTPVIFGDGSQTRDFLFVKDLTDAHFLATQKKISGLFNLGTAQEISVKQIFQEISKAIGYSQEPSFAPRDENELLRSALLFDKFHKETGWTPQTSFKEGILRTIEWNKNYYQN